MDRLAPDAPNPRADLRTLLTELEQIKLRLEAIIPEEAVPSVTTPAPVAFMIMPFGPEDLQIVYDDFVKPVVELRCGLTCVRGDDMFGSSVIMDDVLDGIRSATIVIADLTGQNANVFYEVGIAHAIDKPVLLLAQSLDDVPFDLRHRRVLIYDYSPHGCKRLEVQMEEHLRQMLAEQLT